MRKIGIFALFVLCLGGSSWSYTKTIDGRTWTYEYSLGKITIKGVSPATGDLIIPSVIYHNYGNCNVIGIGSSAFSGCTELSSVTIPSGVTSISYSAFSGCSGLTSVNIPSSVTYIGTGAFSGCAGLGDGVVIRDGCVLCVNGDCPSIVELHDDVRLMAEEVFKGCSGVSSVTIPPSIANVGSYMFSGCAGLKTVKICDGVQGIGSSAFSDCRALVSVEVPSSVTSIGSSAFSGCTSLESMPMLVGVTYIGEKVFYNCRGLTTLAIPTNVTSIGTYAFACCYGLTSVEIPLGVESIGNYAFSNCSGLKSVSIPTSVTSVGKDLYSGNYTAFSGCYSITDAVVPGWKCGVSFGSALTNLVIAEGTTNISTGAFSSCTGLKKVTIPSSVTSIGAGAFADCSALFEFVVAPNNLTYCSMNGLVLSKDGKTVVCGVNGDVSIPSGVTCIADKAFSGCGGLTSIEIPISVTTIRSTAFSGCNSIKQAAVPGWNCCINFSSVTNLVIVDGTTSIPDGAFSGSVSLTRVPIPSSVTSIGSCAFSNCRGLTSITIPPSVTCIGSGAFSCCTSLTNMVLPFVGSCRGNSGTESSLFGYVFGSTSAEGTIETKQVYSSSYYDTKPSYYIPASLRTLEITDETIVGYGAFYGCCGLKVLKISSDLTSIGSYAFYNCSELVSLAIPSSVTSIGSYAFYNCSALTSLMIPSSAMSIGSYAFYNCGALSSLTIPSGVTSIGNYVFYNCGGLMSFSVDASNPVYSAVNGALCSKDGTELLRGVNGDVIVPQGVKSVASGAFYGCTGLTSVTIPYSVISIGYGAFSCCTSLTNMVLPFVGARRGNTGSDDTLFGYVFGQTSSEGAVATEQRYYSPDIARYDERTYYIPKSLCSLEITDETIIGYGAFYGCSSLSSISISKSVTDIGDYAFYNCNGLTSISVPDDVLNIGSCAFCGCGGLKSVAINEGLTSIGSSAFSGCGGIASISIPGSVKSVGGYAFNNCTGLTSVAVLSSATTFGRDYYDESYTSFSGCNSITDVIVPGWKCGIDFSSVTNLVIADGTANIGSSAFADCGGLLSVIIPSSVTSIENGAFSGCSGLTSLTIPSSVTSIGSGALSCCTRLTDIVLPFVGARIGNTGTADSLFGYVFGTTPGDGVVETKQYYSIDSYATYFIPTSLRTVEISGETTIGYGAFYNCNDLESVVIPAGVTNIGDYAFYDCNKLMSAAIPASVESIGDHAFYNCNSVTSMAIPASVTEIGDYAFCNCSCLMSVTIPSNVTSIRESVFSGCSGLKSIIIPEGVTSIGSLAFSGCSGLTSIEIPGSVMNIENGAFTGCVVLTKAVFEDGVTTIDANVFDGCESLTSINIPATVKELNSVPSALVRSMEWDTDGFKILDGWVLDYQDRGVSELIVPEGVVGVGYRAFADMEDLERVALPSSLKYISLSAFEMDTYLDDIQIPDGVEILGDKAFKDCSYIQSISFGTGLKRIGDYAFDGCSQFSSVRFEEGLETIGEYAFNDCWRMLSVSLPLSVRSIETTAFAGCDSLTGVTVPTHRASMCEWFSPVYQQIVNVSIPKGETEIRSSMFESCSALQTVAFVEGITNIATQAFRGCTNLRSLELPRSLKMIGASAFSGCQNLTSVVLPEDVVSIGDHCFYNCYRLGELTLSRSLESLPGSCFDSCLALRSFVVPASVKSLGAYFCPSSVTAIYYLGNAPQADANCYARASKSLTSYVINGTKGWDGRATSRDLPSSWPIDNSYSRPIAFWSANEFDVTFDANGGVFAIGMTNLYACSQITYTPYSLPPYEPILGGAKFGGYWTEPSGGTRVTASTAVKLTKAHTLYAHWDVAPSITVRFNANGGTIVDDTATYTSGEPYGMLPSATREHYNFVGWYTSAKGGMPVVISSEVPYADKELYAHWVPKLYEILYHSCNGKDQTVSQLFTYGDVVALAWNRFFCEGCNFAGWALAEGGAAVYANGAHLGEVSAVQDGTIHLYAVWSGRTYAVRFDSNGGLGSMENQTFVLGVAQHLNAAAFRREGYEFLGWTTVPSGEVVYTDGALVVGLTENQGATVVLFAVWARKGLSLSEAFGRGMASVDVSGDADWITDDETTHDGVASVCNAELAPAEAGKTVATTFTANVAGSGTGSFWWKVSCEEDYYGDWYDYAVFSVDGVEQERIAGETDWVQVEYTIPSTGAHALTWTFVRDDFDEPDAEWENRFWLDDFVWNRDISSYTTADVLNAPDLTFTNGGDGEWFADSITNHDGVISMRSGMITHSQQSWIETTVMGVGELSFWWKANGQVNGSRLYDYLKVEIDGELIARIGVADWTNITAPVTNAGPHKIRWTYLKNASINPEYDCGWLDEIKWTKAEELGVVVPAGITGKADIVIPPAWFKKYPLFMRRFGEDFAAAILKPNGKLLPGGGIGYVWHDYVAGTDPTDVDSCFRAVIRIEGGRPRISWIPELDPSEAAIRIYKTFGKRTLLDSWVLVTDMNRDECRFFKVTVEMK